MTMAEMLIGV